jgi:hypothetical protein
MAGAFVAVADDATATWWNPAGLARGAFVSALYERGHLTEPADPDGASPASSSLTNGFAVAYPAMGLSYYRLRISEIAPLSSTADPQAGRQDPGASGTRSLAVSQYGLTTGQSIGNVLVLATTLKLVRGGVVLAATTAPDPLEAAEDVDVPVETHADLDIGVLANLGSLRVGASVRNVREPDFGEGATALTLKRKARAGASMITGPHGVIDAITIAGDTDLTTTTTLFGDVRHVAGGGEVQVFKRHAAVRGGLSRNTVDEARPAYSYGFSVAPATGVFIDAAFTNGSDDSVRGWSASLRVTF